MKKIGYARASPAGQALEIQISKLRQRKVGLVVLEQGLDTTTAAGETLYQALEAVAEFERSLPNERITIGMA